MRHVLIRARRLSCVYASDRGDVHALRGVDLTLKAGDYAVIIGPAGAGKSTLLRILGFQERPTGGHLLYMGRLVTDLSETDMAQLRDSEIGFVSGPVGDDGGGLAAAQRVLASRPQLLLADEPVRGLARPKSQAVLDLLRRENAAGQTIVLTTEDPEVAVFGKSLYRMCDGVLRPITADDWP